MATRSGSVFAEEMRFGSAMSQPMRVRAEELGSLYAAHYRHVLRVCLRFLRHREDAEDAAAEVFLKLPSVLEQRNGALPFRPWVSRVACRHCIDKLRKRKRERYSLFAGDEINGVPDRSAPSPLTQVLHREKQLQVREQLNRLPDCYRVPLVLRYYKRMSYSEIARVLNRRLPAIKTLLFRAKNRLRRNLRCLE